MKAFAIVLVALSVMFDVMENTPQGAAPAGNFFSNHGVLFLAFVTFFPRLTLLFSSVPSGGLFWWIGLVFCPRVLVAALATVTYYHTNPILVGVSWVVALSGEVLEKKGLAGRKRFVFKTYPSGAGGPFQSPEPDRSPPKPVIKKDDAIEAEFTKKS